LIYDAFKGVVSSLSVLHFFDPMENSKQALRSNIWFLWKNGKTGSEIVEEMVKVYGTHAPSKATVYNWLHHFKDGKENFEDEPRSGCPSTVITDANIERVRAQIIKDRRQTLNEVAEELGMSRSSVHRVLTDHLGMSRLVCRWVPKLLTEQMKNNRVRDCHELLTMYKADPSEFMARIVTGDESWLHYYEPETRQQSSQWMARGDCPPVKAKSCPSAGKRMATVFWDCQGILLIDWLPEHRTINSDYYITVLSNLKDAIKRERRGKWSRGILLQHDNARPHTSFKTTAAVRELGFKTLPHPAYSPDLAPSDYWLFGAMKKPLRGRHYSNLSSLASGVSQWVRDTPKEWFTQGLQKLPDRWEKCISLRGEYVEKCVLE
jgi:histone-lysine N-methyltransferase SETMAR